MMASEKCPVCNWKIENGGKDVMVAGKTLTVCCDDCAQKLKADPDRYARRSQAQD
ncbi:MAG: hypothetical protein O7B26_00515 [Planctomycetota bacterium]|nr:hypothetical protein [Planctomycetota bacterium]